MRGSPLGPPAPRLSGGPPSSSWQGLPSAHSLGDPACLTFGGGSSSGRRKTRVSWRACRLRPSGEHSKGRWRGRGRAPELLLGARRASRGAILCAGGRGPNPRPCSREGAQGVSLRAELGRGHPTPGLQPRRERQGRATQSIKTTSLLFRCSHGGAPTSDGRAQGGGTKGRRGSGPGSTLHQAASAWLPSPCPGCGSLGARPRPPALLQQLLQVLGPLHRRLQRRPRSGLGHPPPALPAGPASGTHLVLLPEATHRLLLLRQGRLHPAGEHTVGLGAAPPKPTAGMRLRAAGGPGGASIPKELAGGCDAHPIPALLTAGPGPSVGVGDWR